MRRPICYTLCWFPIPIPFNQATSQPMFRRVRPLLAIALLALPLATLAQPKLEPLPPPPPAPGGPGAEAPLGEASVSITPGPNDQVEEVVVNGERAVKVTTPDGTVYHLLPDQRDTTGMRPFGDSGLRVPMRVIRQF